MRPRAAAAGGDRVFRGLATGSAAVSLVVVATTLLFLVKEARPAFHAGGVARFFTSSVWSPALGRFGIVGLLLGTVVIASIALLVAVPFSLALALFINEYAPRRLRRPVTTVIDLLAALPSLLFGMWGLFALQGKQVPVAVWFSRHLSILPLFRLGGDDQALVQSSFMGGIVVGLMIVPIITSVSRDVMAQVPRDQCEGALALGGTRWAIIRDVILPFGRSGIIGATLLGFGRALGETIAVAFVIALTVHANPHVLQRGAGSVAALIVLKFGEASSIERSALVAAGLALFLLTLAVNLLARAIVGRATTTR